MIEYLFSFKLDVRCPLIMEVIIKIIWLMEVYWFKKIKY